MVRIGQGWDRHPLAAGRPCVLGGVHFPECPVGPVGHSDGDALCHALTDAVLGAAGLGDIGKMFPDTDPAYAGADSLDLLRRAWRRVAQAGWRLGNADCIVITEQPRLAPRTAQMQANLAQAMGARADQVSVKGTRGEGLGPEGRGECVTAMAAVVLERKDLEG
ncbi:MAG TPA: 2-C-methyl-D-erythritol 2,4-cyclodiphosphate synthase [Candidatus Krumholzibacteria bacterium]|nr:2-C-methyl-D-erythritol 2,4-cyclodiphosphate synthase [Candidatus Krumholzibacteria bacterium]